MRYETMGPVDRRILEKAVDTLNNFGYRFFDQYADENDLSYCDKNRCIAKCKVLYNREDLAERPIPDYLKQARWHHYTKICGYSKQRALKLLRDIDESHETQNQFAPKINAGEVANDTTKSV